MMQRHRIRKEEYLFDTPSFFYLIYPLAQYAWMLKFSASKTIYSIIIFFSNRPSLRIKYTPEESLIFSTFPLVFPL